MIRPAEAPPALFWVPCLEVLRSNAYLEFEKGHPIVAETVARGVTVARLSPKQSGVQL